MALQRQSSEPAESGHGAQAAAARPRISVVTPSYNQAPFLKAALRSVLDQNYPNLEYIVMDGGSTDGSVEIIRKHADRLSFWASEPDAGQYDAINKGFARATGEIMAWINSDDMYFPWAFSVVGEIFAARPEIHWLTSSALVRWDEEGRAIACARGEGYSRDAFFLGRNLAAPGFATRFVMQEATFWRRSLWEAAGARLDTSFSLAADFDLWARFWRHAPLYCTSALLAGFRQHRGQKTAVARERYDEEALGILKRHGGRIPGKPAIALRRWLRSLPGAGRLLGWLGQWVEFDRETGQWTAKTVRFL